MNTVADTTYYAYGDIGRLPDGSYEIIDGERREMTLTGFEHGRLEGRLSEILFRHLKDKGYVAVGEVGILISKQPLRIRAADVVYLSKEKARQQPKGILEIAPDLVIEIISESNTSWAMNDKIKDYLAIGVEKIFLVDPQTMTATLYQKGKKEALLYNFEDDIPLLEGLIFKLKELIS